MITNVPVPDIDNITIADLALDFPQAIRILNRYGLDYCCHGKENFLDACENACLNPFAVWKEIQDEISLTGINTRRQFRNWETNLLIDFIVQHHHEYLRLTIPQIRELLHTVCAVHGDNTNLLDIRDQFSLLAEEVMRHLPREEDVVFPALRRLTKPCVVESPLLDNVQRTISIMEHDHERVGELIRSIRKLSDDYRIPAHACPTYHLLFRFLEEFEYDLLQHIHLENNILFPKVKACPEI